MGGAMRRRVAEKRVARSAVQPFGRSARTHVALSFGDRRGFDGRIGLANGSWDVFR
jgi:hypothetical protein